MGITIHHHAKICGPDAEKVIDDIISQVDQALQLDGVKDRWTEDKIASEHERWSFDGWKRSKILRDYIPRGVPLKQWVGDERNVLPDSAEPERVKGICANIHKESETFCIRFVKDKNSDCWYEPHEFTKTQFSPQSVHVQICEYLKDAKRKAEAHGGYFRIDDEGRYCDDDAPKNNPEELAKNMKANGDLILKVGGMLKDLGWQDSDIVSGQFISKHSSAEDSTPKHTGLDEWMTLRGTPDLCLRVKAENLRKQISIPRHH